MKMYKDACQIVYIHLAI